MVAAGKGEINRLFERDAEKSPYDQPMRALALTYVKNMVPRKPFTAVSFNLVPGVGEYFVFPALTVTGPCEIMVFEGVPSGPMDCWNDVKTPAEHLAKSKWVLDTFMPLEGERCRNVELTDANGILAGRFPPVVRKPICKLPSGGLALGIGDVVATNDPITGQGANTASKAASIYLKRILERRQALRRTVDATNLRRLLGLCAMGSEMDELAAHPARAADSAVNGRGQPNSAACRQDCERIQQSAGLLPLVVRSGPGRQHD